MSEDVYMAFGKVVARLNTTDSKLQWTDNGGATWRDAVTPTNLGIYNVLDYGAKGDAVTDDSDAIQEAMNTVSGAGGGSIYFPPAPSRFRVTKKLTWPSNVQLIGADSIILADPTEYLDTLIEATGVTVATYALTSNAAVGDLTLTVADTAGLAVGDMVRIGDNRRSDRHPEIVAMVTALAATQVTIDRKLGVDYLTANSAEIHRITPVENMVIRGITVECASTSDIRYILSVSRARRLVLEQFRIRNHRTVTSPDTQIGVNVNNGLFVQAEGCELHCKEGNGNAFNFYGVGHLAVRGCHISDYDFACDVTDCYQPTFEGNTCSAWAGTRGLKAMGTWEPVIVGNVFDGYGSPIKIEDSGRAVVMGNSIVNTDGHAINFSGSFADAADRYNVVVGNRVRHVRGATSAGIHLSASANRSLVVGNLLEDLGWHGVYIAAAECLIADNVVIDWGVETGSTAAILFVPTNQVVNNVLISSNAALYSIYINGDPAYGDGTVVAGNVARSQAPYTTARMRLVDRNEANLFGSYGQRRLYANAAPTTGTWRVGDIVYNDTPAAGGNIGWVCVTAGTPGTWKTFGTISA